MTVVRTSEGESSHADSCDDRGSIVRVCDNNGTLPEHGKGMGEQCNRGNTSNGEPARGQLARKVSQHS